MMSLLEYILFVSDDANLDEEVLIDEGAAKRTVVIRNGKRTVKYMCPPGHKKQGRQCRRVSGSVKNKRKRRAIKSARKRRARKAQAVRRRKRSMRKRKAAGL